MHLWSVFLVQNPQISRGPAAPRPHLQRCRRQLLPPRISISIELVTMHLTSPAKTLICRLSAPNRPRANMDSISQTLQGLSLSNSVAASKLYTRWPTIHADRIAFVFDDHLWLTVNGAAHRISSGIAQVRCPLFSPDGTRIAFSAIEDDCEEVYCVNVEAATQLASA